MSVCVIILEEYSVGKLPSSERDASLPKLCTMSENQSLGCSVLKGNLANPLFSWDWTGHMPSLTSLASCWSTYQIRHNYNLFCKLYNHPSEILRNSWTVALWKYCAPHDSNSNLCNSLKEKEMKIFSYATIKNKKIL